MSSWRKSGLFVLAALIPFYGYSEPAKDSLQSLTPDDPLSYLYYTWQGESHFDNPDNPENEGDVMVHSVESEIMLPAFQSEDFALLAGPGVKWTRMDFSQSARLDRIDLYVLSLPIDLVYTGWDRWTLLGSVTPGLFSDLKEITGNDYKTQLHGLALYRIRPSLRLAAGVAYDSDFGDDDLYPLGGCIWDINNRLTMRLVLPRPTMVWAPDDKLVVYAGARATGNKWNMRPLDDGVEYDFKVETWSVGCGVEYALFKKIWFHLDTGVSINRKYTVDNDEGEYFKADADNTYFVRTGLVLR